MTSTARGSWVLGMDLSGPTNTTDTSAAILVSQPDGWNLEILESGLGDQDIAQILTGRIPAGGKVLIGLDAPLSYNPGGGDRPGDRALRKELVGWGLPSGTVMTPTMTRMAYLTLRGMAVARLIEALRPDAEIYEVHPGGTMVRRGASVASVKNLKKSPEARCDLLARLAAQGLMGLPREASDHEIAALAAALAVARLHEEKETWRFSARPPFHPFDLIC